MYEVPPKYWTLFFDDKEHVSQTNKMVGNETFNFKRH